MSGPLAHALANALRPFCRDDGTFSLVDMQQPIPAQQEAAPKRLRFHQAHIFRALLEDAKQEVITLKSLARTHRQRKKQQKAVGSPKPPLKDRITSLVQAVSVLHAAGVGGIGGKLPLEVMAVLEAEERLLEVVYRNKKKRTIMGFTLKAITLWFYILVRLGPDKR